jgi:molecular chaperone GrpE
MSTNKSHDKSHEPPPPSADDAADGEAAAMNEAPLSEVDRLKKEALEWKERCARLQAEFDNVRKRLRKEADEAGTRAIARFVRPILNELDNLERAVGAARPEAFHELAQGVSLIRENLKSALAGAGIETIPAEGPFDPSVHEAIAEAESSTVPRGHIVTVHRHGYRLKDQLVRSAQVVVAKPPAEKP